MPWLDSSDDNKVLPLKGEEDVKIIAYMPENYTPDPELEKEMYLTEEEERKVIDIAINDPVVKSILDKAKGWKVLHIGPSTEEGKKVGGALVIILDEAVWVEGEFKTLKGIDRVSTWSKSLLIRVDLSKEEVVSIDVGSTIPTQEMPPEGGDKYSKAKEVAKSRALQEENLKDKNLNVLFVRADIIEEYPDGIAFFLIRSEHGDEMMVAVDMRSMQVVEKYTAKVVG